MQKAKNFIKDTSLYVASSGLSKILVIILIPLYTKYLTVQEFGQYDLSLTVVSILSIIFAFGLPQALQLEFFELKKNSTLIKQIFSTHIVLSILCLPCATIILFFLNIIPRANSNSLIYCVLSFTIVAQSFASFYQTSLLNILKITQQTKFYFFLSLIVVIIQCIVSVVALVYLKNKVAYLLLSNFLGLLVVSVVCLKKLNIVISIDNFSFTTIYEKSKLGIIMVAGYFAYWLVNGADRWIVLKLLGDYDLGIYSIAARVSSVVEPLLLTPIISAYLPISFKKYASNSYNEPIATMIVVVIPAFIIFSIGAYYILPYILSSKTPSEAFHLMPYFIVGYGFYFISQISVNILVYKKDFKLLLKNIIIVATINIVLNVVLLKFKGLSGSAYAFLIANFIWMLLSLFSRDKTIKRFQFSGK